MIGWNERFLDSDFTRADLVYGAADAARRAYRILGVDERAGDAEDRRAWQVESLPAEAAQGAAQDRIVTWIDLETAIPLRVDFHAADGLMVRTLRIGDLRAVPGRPFPYPHRWVMRRSGKEGRESRIEVQAIRFEPAFEPGLFTTRRLPFQPR